MGHPGTEEGAGSVDAAAGEGREPTPPNLRRAHSPAGPAASARRDPGQQLPPSRAGEDAVGLGHCVCGVSL